MPIKTYVYAAKEPLEERALVHQQIERVHRYYNTLIDIERARQTGLAVAESQADKDRIKEENNRAVRDARARSGCYWGTYLVAEASLQQAGKTCFVKKAKEAGNCGRCKNPVAEGSLITFRKKLGGGFFMDGCETCGNGPRYKRWEGEGIVAVQFQSSNSCTVEKLLAGTDSRARLVGNGKHRLLYLRVGSEGREPIFASFPIVYHRDIPAYSRLTWIRVCSRKCGPHTEWSVQFVIDVPFEQKKPLDRHGILAMDVGFRDFGVDGMRVAVGNDSDGNIVELRLPHYLALRHKKVQDLRSIRAKNFNAARDVLCAARKNRNGWPDWLVAETEHAHAWRSEERLSGLIWRWKDKRWDGDGDLYAEMEAWRKQDKHLWTWESAQRSRIIRQRLDIYRNFAHKISTRYESVIAERIDLARLAVDVANELPDGPRGNRFDAALASLLDSCAIAVAGAGGSWKEVDAKDTTRECSVCGEIEPESVGPSLEHTCSKCGAVWDQDYNAAKVILARAIRGIGNVEGRSRAKKAVSTGESAVSARRKAGKERKKASLSKNESQPEAIVGV